MKQNWFPGLICIPIFHCRGCLALWTQAAQIPRFCSEVNRSVYGRLIPISITKCDLLTKLLNHDRKPTARRLCKEFDSGKPVKPVLRMKEDSLDESFGGRSSKSIPIAEFVDINEQLGKYRRKLSLEFRGIGSETSGRRLISRGHAGSPVGDFGTEDGGKSVYGGLEVADSNCETEDRDVKTSGVNQESKFNPSKLQFITSCFYGFEMDNGAQTLRLKEHEIVAYRRLNG